MSASPNTPPAVDNPLLAAKPTGHPDTLFPEADATLSIALSGGGYRATLFHLGAMRRLNELGVTKQIEVFSSVSGGSILSAHLAHLSQHGKLEDVSRTDFELPLIDFVRGDIRTLSAMRSWAWALLGLVAVFFVICFRIYYAWWERAEALILAILAVAAWTDRGCGARLLASAYHRLNPAKLKDLRPGWPLFIFCSTDIVFGVLWRMTRQEVGDYQAGYASTPGGFRVADAVAASSCFPPVFFPTPMRPENLSYSNGMYHPIDKRREWAKKIRLTDGGVYDNLGVEPIWKDGNKQVLVSDGGGPMLVATQTWVTALLLRYNAIIQNQALALRKRMLIGQFTQKLKQGAYWGLNSAVEKYAAKMTPPSSYAGYGADFVDEWIAHIRTDLAYFSPEEVGILINHGYTLAEAAVQTHCPKLIDKAKPPAPFAIPYPRLMDENVAKIYLQNSHKLIVFERIRQSWRGHEWYLSRLDSYL